jgi:ABC-type dipeptide/oligopeptide/nickel transport system ATPase subunit
VRCWLYPSSHELTILEVTDLRKHFSQNLGLLAKLTGETSVIPAVDGVSFYLRENETVGLVGESGCGKTTIGRTVLRLTDPTGGRIVFDGRDITRLIRAELRPLRREMQMIFQDLDAGLNPAMRVRDILREALTVHERPGDAEIAAASAAAEQVNLKDSKLANFPSELSGARSAESASHACARARRRRPTSALDISIRRRSSTSARSRAPLYLFAPPGGRAGERKGRGDVPRRIVDGAGRTSPPILHADPVVRSPRSRTSGEPARAASRSSAAPACVDFEHPARGCRPALRSTSRDGPPSAPIPPRNLRCATSKRASWRCHFARNFASSGRRFLLETGDRRQLESAASPGWCAPPFASFHVPDMPKRPIRSCSPRARLPSRRAPSQRP